MKEELEIRKQRNPVPTNEELNMGTFIEGIEPQVRDAVLDFSRKGYSTESSGFYGRGADYQSVEGFFTLDEETQIKLKAIGVEVELHKARLDGDPRKKR